MEGLNKVQVIGNLGQEPELRTTPGGQTVLQLRLAATETYKDRNGVKQENTEWFTCAVWGPRGEALAKILNKGDRIYAEGSLKTTASEKDGIRRYFTEVNVRNVILLGNGKGKQTQASTSPADDTPPGLDAAPDDLNPDEIPF